MTYPSLVTLEQARMHLMHVPSLTGLPDDADLELKIAAATQAVCDYIKDRQPEDLEWVAEIEGWGAGSPVSVPPPVVVASVLVQVGSMYRWRGDDEEPQERHLGAVCPEAANLLARYRSPSLA